MLVGLVPMGGFAQRWQPYPGPKEMLPFGSDEVGRPRVIADYVLRRMVAAGVEMVVIPLRVEKAFEVMSYLGHHLSNGALITYVAAPGPSVLANIQACVPLLRGHQVLFGFPDTYFLPEQAFTYTLQALEPAVEMVLGSFSNHQLTRMFLVEREGSTLNAVRTSPRLPAETGQEVWGLAAWNPAFTERLAAWSLVDGDDPSFVLNAAAQAGHSRCVPMPPGEFYEDLASYQIYQKFVASNGEGPTL